jgi:uncharacterized protein YcbK (DUF882 family)
MITLTNYFTRNGVDLRTTDIVPTTHINNALGLLSRVNGVLATYPAKDTLKVNSGYRTAAVNKLVGGAKYSNHMTAMAIDIADTKGNLYAFLLKQPLTKLGLYMERKESTPTWVHLQTKATVNNPFKP